MRNPSVDVRMTLYGLLFLLSLLVAVTDTKAPPPKRGGVPAPPRDDPRKHPRGETKDGGKGRVGDPQAEKAKEKDKEQTRWEVGFCQRIIRLMKQKDLMVKQLDQLASLTWINHDMSEPERDFQLATLRLFTKELNETESMIIQSLIWLENSVKADYQDLASLKESSKSRLDGLRDATLKEEREYNFILKAEERLKQFNQSRVEGVVAAILHDVAKAADQLEQQLDENIFDAAMGIPGRIHGDNIEAVIRLEGGNENGDSDNHDNHADGDEIKREVREAGGGAGIIKLVDAQNNQFVLSKGKDSTVPVEDHHFIQDVVYVVITAFAFAWVCSIFALPTMFGYIVGGVVLGPSGFNVLKSLVQLETLGEFGAFLILFTLGLEFSLTKIKKVFSIAVFGTLLMMLFMVVGGLGLGVMLQASTSESVFIAACLSLSSTPLVIKFLNPSGSETGGESPSQTEYGMVLLGILVMQDVLLGLLMAVLPVMSGSLTTEQRSLPAIAVYGFLILELIAALALVLVLCVVFSKVLVGPMYRLLYRKGSRELLLLGTMAVAFLMLKLTDYVGISMELGCFLAGVVISSQEGHLAEEVEHLIGPIKDFLASIFFASIGLHVFPQFLAYEMTVLTTLTMATVGAKYVIGVLVLALLSRKSRTSWYVKWIVSAGLAQVSEFSFVLGSRARRLGLINRELYLLILGVTTLSLLFAPVIWKSTLWQLRVRHSASSGGGTTSLSALSAHAFRSHGPPGTPGSPTPVSFSLGGDRGPRPISTSEPNTPVLEQDQRMRIGARTRQNSG